MYHYSYGDEKRSVTNYAELHVHANIGCVVADEAGDFEQFQRVDELGILYCTEHWERNTV